MRNNTNKKMCNIKIIKRAITLIGKDYWTTEKTDEIRSLLFSDGSVGVRREDKSKPTELFNKYDSFPSTCIPCGAAVGASFNEKLIEKVYGQLGGEAASFNIDILLAPAFNIKRIPIGGRNFEYFSEDPYLSGKIAVAAIKGIQSAGVGACVKHFCTNNCEYNREKIDIEVDEQTLRELYYRNFEIAIKQGKPYCVMSAYNKLNGDFCSEKASLLNNILREEWKYNGVVISDWRAVHNRGLALKAGCDLEMPNPGEEKYNEFLNECKNGDIEEKYINKSFKRIKKLAKKTEKKKIKSFNNGYQLALRLAEESIVLLKNDEILPIEKNKKVVIIGKAAIKSKFQGGGSAAMKAYKCSQPYDELKKIFDCTYTTGEDEKQLNQLLKQSSVAIIFLASSSKNDTEGGDSSSMALSCQDLTIIDRVCNYNLPIVVVLQTGGPVEIPFISKVNAIIETFLNGEAGGEAIAEVISGKVNPSGRLAETFPINIWGNSFINDYNSNPNRMIYKEKQFNGYRYYVLNKEKALYPFGYGLSYSKFVYESAKMRGKKVIVKVKNISHIGGKIVLQVYSQNRKTHLKKLIGFSKNYIEKNSVSIVNIKLDDKAFFVYDIENKKWKNDVKNCEIHISDNAFEEGITIMT